MPDIDPNLLKWCQLGSAVVTTVSSLGAFWYAIKIHARNLRKDLIVLREKI